MAAHIFFACWLNYKQEIIGETVCCVRQGFNKNLSPQTAYGRKSYRS